MTEKVLQDLYKDCMLNIYFQSRIDESRHQYHQIFLWAVLSNMPDMAFHFWSRGHNALKKCLIAEAASKMMVKIGRKRKLLDDLISEFMKSQK